MSPSEATAVEMPDSNGPERADPFVGEPESLRLELAVRRVRELAARAEAERVAAERLGTATTKPTRRPPRIAEIDRLCTMVVPTPAGAHHDALKEASESLHRLRNSLVANPLWIAATLHESAPEPAAGVHLRAAHERMEPELKAARDHVADCAGKVLDAEAALREWESRPSWARAAEDWLLQTGQRTEHTLTTARTEVAAAQAALDEKHAQAEAEAARQKATQERADRERRERATFHREVLEIPLREALLERAMLVELLHGRSVAPLREAPPGTPLTLRTPRSEHGFHIAVLESPDTTYLADWAGLQSAHGRVLDRAIEGDVFRYARDEGGHRTLVTLELAALTPRMPVLEGVVGATHRRESALLEFQLIDGSGTARWVKPSGGMDLMAELRGDVATALVSGNHVRLQQGEVHLISRARSAGRDR